MSPAAVASLILPWFQAATDSASPPLRVAPSVGQADEVRVAPRAYSAHHGWLLRSNAALGLGKIDGVSLSSTESEPLSKFRFATTNHVSIGYGWQPNWALTLDGFRAVVPHYPHSGQDPEFSMRVDTETLGLGLGSTFYVRQLALHVGASVGYAMTRIGGSLLKPPTHGGVGSLSFAGIELMRSQGIGVVLSAQMLGVVASHQQQWLTTRTYSMALGVTYW